MKTPILSAFIGVYRRLIVILSELITAAAPLGLHARSFLCRVLPVHRQTNQSAHRQARGTFCQVGFGLVEPGGSGDIQVDPGRILGELLEEESGRYSASPAPPDVGDIGKRALEVLLV